MTHRSTFRLLAILTIMICAPGTRAVAQAGVPGARIDAGREHLAAARAEAYLSAATFFDRWKSAWDARDADALGKLYTDDASVRLPGRIAVRTREPVESALREAVPAAAPITMADVDFHVSAETVALVACYYTEQEGRPVSGMVTTVLQPSGRSWRIRIQIFDPPRPTGTGDQRFGC